MEIFGDIRTYLVVNTTEYNNDGKWAVQSAHLDELNALGFEVEDVLKISLMSIGEVLSDWSYNGLIVIRLA